MSPPLPPPTATRTSSAMHIDVTPPARETTALPAHDLPPDVLTGAFLLPFTEQMALHEKLSTACEQDPPATPEHYIRFEIDTRGLRVSECGPNVMSRCGIQCQIYGPSGARVYQFTPQQVRRMLDLYMRAEGVNPSQIHLARIKHLVDPLGSDAEMLEYAPRLGLNARNPAALHVPSLVQP